MESTQTLSLEHVFMSSCRAKDLVEPGSLGQVRSDYIDLGVNVI